MKESKQNKIIILIGAGGSGKTSIARELEKTGNFTFAPSTTTRKIREGERDGRDYFFVTKEQFNHKIKNGQMLEYVSFNGNFYGTDKKMLTQILKEKNCVIDCEESGAKKIKEAYPDKVITIFVYVSVKDLEKRMKDRGDSQEHIKKRLELAKIENKSRFKFDFIVENKAGKLNDCVDSVLNITQKSKI